MKFIFRLIGIIVVLLILLMAVLSYLDGKDLLSGKLERLISSLRVLGQEAWVEIRYFMDDSGISEDAAGLLEQGADFLRESVEPHATSQPGVDAIATVSPVPTATPVPTVTPVVIG